jgi:predicted DNA binding CopG/RHH family protein
MSKPGLDKGKPFPTFTTDEDAEHFLETADLSEYDFSGFVPANFELRRKDARVNMRVPATQLAAVKEAAAKQGIPYQRFIRNAIDQALAHNTDRRHKRAS